jgi:hypothetical protein
VVLICVMFLDRVIQRRQKGKSVGWLDTPAEGLNVT